jgi:hypothetical protein
MREHPIDLKFGLGGSRMDSVTGPNWSLRTGQESTGIDRYISRKKRE